MVIFLLFTFKHWLFFISRQVLAVLLDIIYNILLHFTPLFSLCFGICSRKQQHVFCQKVSLSLGRLKVLCLYLDFPLRCISLGHDTAAQRRGERGPCSGALWLTEDHSAAFQPGMTHCIYCRDSPLGLGRRQHFVCFLLRYVITNALMQHVCLPLFKEIAHGDKLCVCTIL